MLYSGKINILPKISERNKKPFIPPPFQVKWSVPNSYQIVKKDLTHPKDHKGQQFFCLIARVYVYKTTFE